jgi:sulfoxide reductase heme-binding subunit YedZ
MGKNWVRLHWLAYGAIALAVAHFALSVKADLREPLAYAAVAALLLIARVPAIDKLITTLRPRRQG